MISGTKEWSVHSFNSRLGCAHGCRYCYARDMAVRYGRTTKPEWTNEKPLLAKPRRFSGRVMYPTTHDLTPDNLDHTLAVLSGLARLGNDLLIVTKGHPEVVSIIADRWPHVLLRITIGGLSEKTREFWEPNAPPFASRIESLRIAHSAGMKVGVSAEPLLEPWAVIDLAEAVLPYTTDTFWIGTLNKPEARIYPKPESSNLVNKLIEHQTPDKIQTVYDALIASFGNDRRLRWKESYKRVLGLELQTEAGTDR